MFRALAVKVSEAELAKISTCLLSPIGIKQLLMLTEMSKQKAESQSQPLSLEHFSDCCREAGLTHLLSPPAPDFASRLSAPASAGPLAGAASLGAGIGVVVDGSIQGFL